METIRLHQVQDKICFVFVNKDLRINDNIKFFVFQRAWQSRTWTHATPEELQVRYPSKVLMPGPVRGEPASVVGRL